LSDFALVLESRGESGEESVERDFRVVSVLNRGVIRVAVRRGKVKKK
jgi:hypothetical protein